jgi:lipid II:glycine glycyltransferase (peptidoglycan interpeptide bridge formation enzyme)
LATVRKWKHLELRDGNIPPSEAKPFKIYSNHHLDLRPGIGALYQNLDTAVRRAIRKSESSEISIALERSSTAMNDFYSLHERTRRRHGLPPQPPQFFTSIYRNLVERDLGSIVLARLAGLPVAGAVFLHSAKRAIYKFGASDTKHWPSRPNQGVMWTAIRELVKSGCEDLQFGRTSTADEGLARFKLSWGSVSQPISYYRFISQSGNWMKSDRNPAESHPLIFGHLPVICNRIAGRLIYPHLD